MIKKIKQWISIELVKNTGKIVLGAILLFNVIFFIVAALIISKLSLSGTESMGFFEAAYYTITMILDAGCISFVVEDIGQSGLAIAIICIVIILIGMVSFTGAVIGYITNFISGYFERANDGTRKLSLSNHIVILNWNTRASEIVNDLLYCGKKTNVVVLVGSNKNDIVKEISEKLSSTVSKENKELKEHYKDMGYLRRTLSYFRNKLRNKVTVVVREGDVFSSKQLHDISLEYARTCIILGNDRNFAVCKYDKDANVQGKGDSLVIKTLMQVADITASVYSSDDQKIIVEVTDEWTEELVDSIIKYKQVDGKCNIVPIKVNKILGQLLSQFSLMPELNLAYRELFSNKGVTFYDMEAGEKTEEDYIRETLDSNKHVVPLTVINGVSGYHAFYAAASPEEIDRRTEGRKSDYTVKINQDYWIDRKKIIICGHNSKCKEVMDGFANFRSEWNYRDGNGEILDIIVIDDKENLEKMKYYEAYPFVTKTVAAGIYDKEIISSTIEEVTDQNEEDTSILILSDDTVSSSELDAKALTNLVYVQDIINRKKATVPDFDPGSIDVIVEIIDPKHHDIVSSYSVNNVVISNRYISKMITQIGEKDTLYEFYKDILTYDEGDGNIFTSKEIYTKQANQYFSEIPKECTAYELIRAVYNASSDERIPVEKRYPAIMLGYVSPTDGMTLFGGNQENMKVVLHEDDKIIVYSNH